MEKLLEVTGGVSVFVTYVSEVAGHEDWLQAPPVLLPEMGRVLGGLVQAQNRIEGKHLSSKSRCSLEQMDQADGGVGGSFLRCF